MVLVNDKPATTATYIHSNDIIALKASLPNTSKKTLQLTLEVLYEDDYLAVINKPAGILVSGNRFMTVANALPQCLTPSLQLDAVQPQPVHRIDYPTTGLLLIGKTATSIQSMNTLFENKAIDKTYYAVTIGAMPVEGKISIPIDGKEALSHYKVFKTVSSKRFQFLNLVRLTPKTGRRHQLRKHLAALGNPILGDQTYGKAPYILKGKGLYLHAFRLTFIHPFTKKEMTLEKIVPSKFSILFDS